MKKSIATLFTILVLCVLFCIAAPKADATTVASGSCGDECCNVTWTLDDTGCLIITGSGRMEDFGDGNFPDWDFCGGPQITKVIITGSVTYIGNYAFSSKSELTEVIIGNSVTSIGECAFWWCTKLETVRIPDRVEVIGDSAFSYCESLNSLTLGNKVHTIGDSAFNRCFGLTSVTIPDSVQYIGPFAFIYCTALKSVSFGDGSKEIGGYAFYGCASLPSVDIPGTVEIIGEHAFSECTALASVIIGEGVERIEDGAFSNCSNLCFVVIPSTVTYLDDWAFYSDTTDISVVYCGTQEQWDAIEAEEYWKEYIDQLVQFHCYDDTDVCIYCGKANCYTGTCGENCTWILDKTGCLTITGSGRMENYGDGKLPGWSTCNGPQVTKVIVTESVTHIGAYAFASSHELTGVTIGNSVTSIGEGAFSGCTALKDIELSEKTTIIGISAFEGCVSLVDITIPQKVTHIEKNAFKGCTGLTFVELPAGITSVGGGSFADCANLKEITFIGLAPKIWTAFTGVTATVYYPASEAGWTKEMLQNYGGTITWVPYGMVEKFDIDVARMILGNALEFQFGVDMTKIPDLTGVYAVVEKSWADRSVTKTVIPASQWGVAGKYYAIVYDGLAAKEMADSFNVTIYNANDEAISNPKTDSVRDYVKRAFDSQTVKGKTMLVDMLNYGAAAQQNFKYNIDDLANNQLTAEQKAYGTKTAAPTTNNLVKDINYKGTRLVLESRIQMQVAFTGLDRTMYAQYTYRDHNDKVQIVTVAGSEFIEVSGLYGIELNKLVYADARQIVTVQIYNSQGALVSTVQDSIESYVNRSGATDPLFDALMKFTDSAKAYLHQ